MHAVLTMIALEISLYFIFCIYNTIILAHDSCTCAPLLNRTSARGRLYQRHLA